MFLDTGVYGEVFDPSVAGFLPPSMGETTVNSVGGKRKAKLFVAPSITLGSWHLPEMVCVESDMEWWRKGIGRDARGVLGWGAIRETAIKVDFDHQKLQFIAEFNAPTSAKPYTGAAAKDLAYVFLSVENDSRIPMIRSTIRDIPVEWMMDMGTNHCLGLKHDLFDKMVKAGVIHRDTSKAKDRTLTAVGNTPLAGGHFTEGNLLGVALKDLPVYDTGDANLIGLSFLINFNLIIDFSGNRLYFTRRNTTPPISTLEMLGAVLEYGKEGCGVWALHPEHGRAAEAAGLAVGDLILQLGALRGENINGSTVYNLCRTGAGKVIEVQASRAKTKEIFKTRLRLSDMRYLYPPR